MPHSGVRFVTGGDRFVTESDRVRSLSYRSDRMSGKLRVLTEDALPDSGGERLGGEENVDEIQAGDGPG